MDTAIRTAQWLQVTSWVGLYLTVMKETRACVERVSSLIKTERRNVSDVQHRAVGSTNTVLVDRRGMPDVKIAQSAPLVITGRDVLICPWVRVNLAQLPLKNAVLVSTWLGVGILSTMTVAVPLVPVALKLISIGMDVEA